MFYIFLHVLLYFMSNDATLGVTGVDAEALAPETEEVTKTP